MITYENNRVSLPRLIKGKEVRAVLAISNAALMGMVARGECPAPVRVGRRMLRWDAAELKEWLEAGCPAVSEEGRYVREKR